MLFSAWPNLGGTPFCACQGVILIIATKPLKKETGQVVGKNWNLEKRTDPTETEQKLQMWPRGHLSSVGPQLAAPPPRANRGQAEMSELKGILRQQAFGI